MSAVHKSLAFHSGETGEAAKECARAHGSRCRRGVRAGRTTPRLLQRCARAPRWGLLHRSAVGGRFHALRQGGGCRGGRAARGERAWRAGLHGAARARPSARSAVRQLARKRTSIFSRLKLLTEMRGAAAPLSALRAASHSCSEMVPAASVPAAARSLAKSTALRWPRYPARRARIMGGSTAWRGGEARRSAGRGQRSW
jgi:hypothetical protein